MISILHLVVLAVVMMSLYLFKISSLLLRIAIPPFRPKWIRLNCMPAQSDVGGGARNTPSVRTNAVCVTDMIEDADV